MDQLRSARAPTYLLFKVREDECGHGGHALAIADLWIVVGKGDQDLEEAALAKAEALVEVDMVAHGSVNVEVDLAVVGGGLLVEGLEAGKVGGQLELLQDERPHLSAQRVGNALEQPRLELGKRAPVVQRPLLQRPQHLHPLHFPFGFLLRATWV